MLKHPEGSSLLFHRRVGKTLRRKTSRAFAVKQTANPAICPVRKLQFFVELCNSMGLDLSSGFLFRPTSKNGGIVNAPLLASTVQARLVKYLSSLGINDGESVHGFRSGISLLHRLLGVSREYVARHIGWKSTALVDYYILKWTRLLLPIPLQIPWLVVLLTLDEALRQNFSGTLSVDPTPLLVLRRPFYKFFVLFCFIFLYWLYYHFSFGVREGDLRVHRVGEAGCRLSLHLGLSAPPSQGLACPVTYLSSSQAFVGRASTGNTLLLPVEARPTKAWELER